MSLCNSSLHVCTTRRTQDYLPHVKVAASTFGAIAAQQQQHATPRGGSSTAAGSSSFKLQLALSVSSSNQVTFLIQEHDPLSELKASLSDSSTVSWPSVGQAACVFISLPQHSMAAAAACPTIGGAAADTQ